MMFTDLLTQKCSVPLTTSENTTRKSDPYNFESCQIADMWTQFYAIVQKSQ